MKIHNSLPEGDAGQKPKSQIRAGIILSYCNLFLGSVIPFVYTPIMLRYLGQAEYGLYQLANSVIGYLGLLNFGLGLAITRYISKYRVLGDKKNEEIMFGFFLKAYLVLTLLVVICGIGLTCCAQFVFDKGLTPYELEKIRKLLLIMTASTAVSFPTSVFSAVVTCHERFVFRKLLDTMLTVAGPALNLVALLLGFSSIGMATATTMVQIVTLPIYVLYCLKRIGVRPRFDRVEKSVTKELLHFSAFVLLGTAVELLYWSTDKVLLGAIVGTTAVAVYNIGATFNNIVMNMSGSIVSVLVPKINEMVVKEESPRALSSLFIKVGRIQYIILALVVSGFAVFGRPFIALWAGSGYEDSYIIALLTMVPMCIPLIQNVGFQIIVAQNNHAFRQITYAVIAVVNVVATFLIVPYMGGIGAALCSCAAYLLGHGVAMNLFYWKKRGLTYPHFGVT